MQTDFINTFCEISAVLRIALGAPPLPLVCYLSQRPRPFGLEIGFRMVWSLVSKHGADVNHFCFISAVDLCRAQPSRELAGAADRFDRQALNREGWGMPVRAIRRWEQRQHRSKFNVCYPDAKARIRP